MGSSLFETCALVLKKLRQARIADCRLNYDNEAARNSP
jgi:hypothetical protein